MVSFYEDTLLIVTYMFLVKGNLHKSKLPGTLWVHFILLMYAYYVDFQIDEIYDIENAIS